MLDLFADESPWSEPLAPGAVILRRQAREQSAILLAAIEQVAALPKSQRPMASQAAVSSCSPAA